MKLSIIIPTHNRAKQLSIVLDSIKNLSDETSFEVVVVDNNSNDNTKEVANSYRKFVSVKRFLMFGLYLIVIQIIFLKQEHKR